jgi:photosystem II stability/assembly factor-like uncharacterized protein
VDKNQLGVEITMKKRPEIRWTQEALAAVGVFFPLAVSAACNRSAEVPIREASPSASALCSSDDWSIVRAMDFGQSTLSVMFGDESFGVATDLGGGIHYTEDGGSTWTYAATAGRSRVALEISEGDERIWHIGFGGAVGRSTDRAHTWEPVSFLPYNGHVEYVSFANADAGWVATTELPTFFVTADGAKTWTAHPLPEGMGKPAALHLRTPRDGYLLDRAGNLFQTADGGATWEERSLGLEQGFTIPTLNHSAAMRFTDDRHGLIALNLLGGGSGRVLVLRTKDGGATWSEEPLPVGMGMFHLTRNGVYLTHVDLMNHAKIILLCSAKALHP